MNKITRNSFLKQTFRLSGLAMLRPLDMFLSDTPVNTVREGERDDELLKDLIAANDSQVDKLLQSDYSHQRLTRRIGHEFATLCASYSLPDSRHYNSVQVVTTLEKTTELLLNAQAADGTVNIGNLESPPDTAFLLELLTAGNFLLAEKNSAELEKVSNNIKKFLVKAGDALSTGGVHTPNHRWVICAALARLNVIYPNEKYVRRIEDWLGEGIFIDADGQFPERSRIYSYVEDESLITIGRLLNKSELFVPVGKNLQMTYYYMEPNGDLVTTDSRRQDQYMSKSIVSYYLLYRYMAIKENNGRFASIARLIETMKGFQEEIINTSLFHFLENRELQKKLPAGDTLPLSYEKIFTTTHLLRIRRGPTSITLFGGVDWPVIIASGRSNSPNFFSYRKGDAVLQYMRLSSNFFSMGYFYSEGLREDGNKYILNKKLEVPYYQPMEKNRRNPRGDYKLSLSTDGRFWNKMDFQNRPVSNVKTLETTVTFF